MLMGDVAFTRTWNVSFDTAGYDTNGDGIPDTNHDWADDSFNVDELSQWIEPDACNGSKWVSQATYTVDSTSICIMFKRIAFYSRRNSGR